MSKHKVDTERQQLRSGYRTEKLTRVVHSLYKTGKQQLEREDEGWQDGSLVTALGIWA